MTTEPALQPARHARHARLKDKRVKVDIGWDFILRSLLKVPTFLPFLFVGPAVVLARGSDLSTGVADVLGTGSELLLIFCLLVTPLSSLTGWKWIIPMRRWYGVMFALSAISDAVIALITTTDFSGGPLGRIAGHTFLFTGLVMVMILIALLLTANTPAQKALGKYWKWFQRLTYVVWALLVVHLALLEGFGIQRGDGLAVMHQRLYQFVAVSIPLVVLRIPGVKRWATGMRKDKRTLEMWLAIAPLCLLFLAGFVFIEHEFLFKGIALLRLNPSTD